MAREYDHAVLIGRFQPLHNEHVALIRRAFSIADHVIILVGSAHAAPTPENPFTFDEREDMIRAAFPDVIREQGGTLSQSTEYDGRLDVLPLRDYHYCDSTWIAQVQAVTDPLIPDGDAVALLGTYKDSSSYYLNMFPQWEFSAYHSASKLSATQVRMRMFDVNHFVRDHEEIPTVQMARDSAVWLGINVPATTLRFLNDFQKTRRYGDLLEEHRSILDYKASWARSPYKPMFVTADAVVTCAGHVLIVKRKYNPGKGKYALPGGFVKPTERVRAAAIRELREETRIKVDSIILDSSIVDSRMFDYPERSLRGRTITTAYHIDLRYSKLPEIKGGSDAEKCFWMPLMDVNRLAENWFEDHVHILNYFINKS